MDQELYYQDVQVGQLPQGIHSHPWHHPKYVLSPHLLSGTPHRLQYVFLASLTRKARKDVTLVDGTVIPKGTFVAPPQSATHLNEEYYPDANTFDPFRFSRAREAQGQELKHQFVNTSTEFIAFGHGKHAWCVAFP